MRGAVWIVVSILLLGLYPVSAQETCPVPALEGGLQAWVSSVESQPLYESIGSTSPVLTTLQPGRIVFILNGLTCAEGMNWWMVTARETDDLRIGWIHEGNAAYSLLRGSITNANFVSLTLVQGLATNATVRDVPATENASQPWMNGPGYLRVILDDYREVATLAQHFAELRFFRVADFADYDTALGERGMKLVAALQGVIEQPAGLSADPAMVVDDVLFGDVETQTRFRLQPQLVHFQNGSGYRLLIFTPTGFYRGLPDLEYRYMGLSADGNFLVTAIFPLGTPVLASQFAASAPIGDPLEAYVDYVNGMVNYLGQADADTFNPSLADLDLLIASILVDPLLVGEGS
jgi:hypothetical protein